MEANSKLGISSPIPIPITDHFSMLFSHYFVNQVKVKPQFSVLKNLKWTFEGPTNPSVDRHLLFPPSIKVCNVFGASNFEQSTKFIISNWYKISDDDLESVLETFLNNLFQMDLFKFVFERLKSFDLIADDLNAFENYFKRIWFYRFKWTKHADKEAKKSDEKKVCAFEHVYIGQKRGRKVKGFHFWQRYFILEKQGSVVLQDVLKYQTQLNLATLKFKWDEYVKKYGTIFFGNAIELEILIYTVAFIIKSNRTVPFLLDGYPVHVQTYDVATKDDVLATAFFRY